MSVINTFKKLIFLLLHTAIFFGYSQYETKDIDYKINFIDKVYQKHQICDYRILMDELVNLGNNSDSENETGSENEEDYDNQNEEDN